MKKLLISLTIAGAVVVGMNSASAGSNSVISRDYQDGAFVQDTTPKKDTSKMHRKKHDPAKKDRRDSL